MPAFIDITGLSFGRLTAVSRVQGSRRPVKWVFRCECGNILERDAAAVRYGTTRSCGCLRRETTAKNRSHNLNGQVFDRLTVVSLAGKDKFGFRCWDCLCSCGKKCTATTYSLRGGKKRSCGCIRVEQMRTLGLSTKQENPISQTREYKRAMKKKLNANPIYSMRSSISRMLCLAIQRVGGVKSGKTFDILGYSVSDLKKHIERQFLPGMSWENRSEWQIDHITPSSSAKTLEDVISLNQLSNLRPMWSVENNKKGSRKTHLL